MDDKQTSSSWDDLLRQVGAEPPTDALERKRPAIETRFEPPVAPPPVEKPKAGDWNALASQLGVEAVEPPPATPSVKPARRTEPAKGRSAPTAGDLESSFAGIAPIESEFEDVVEAEIDDIDFTDDDSELEEDAMAVGRGDEEDDDPDSLSGEAARTAFEALFQAGSFGALPSRESSPPNRGRSGESRPSGESRTSREPREPREPRSRRESRDRDAPKDRWGRPVREPQSRRAAGGDDLDSGGPLGDAADESAAGAAGDSEEGREEGDRPRRRRRRRGGRGRDRDRDAPAAAEPKKAPVSRANDDEDEWAEPLDADESSQDEDAETEAPAGEGDEERPVRRRRGRRRGRRGSRTEEEKTAAAEAGADRNGRSSPSRIAKRSADDDDDDDSEDSIASHAGDVGDEGDDDDDDSVAVRSSHKNIPTWSDAISVMIETNMQGRKSAPQRPSGRERGGRGRSRGGRGGGGGRGRGGS